MTVLAVVIALFVCLIFAICTGITIIDAGVDNGDN
jgi:hypothetical protein